jgi:hypothetical protein
VTCFVVVQNPDSSVIMPITDAGTGTDTATWATADEAEDAVQDHALVKAWGGWIIDLDNCEVKEI